MSDVKIAGCHECPLYDGEWTVCGHPDVVDSFKVEDEARSQRETDLSHAWMGHDGEGREVLRAPMWCPLRQGVLTLQLRTKGEPKVKR